MDEADTWTQAAVAHTPALSPQTRGKALFARCCVGYVMADPATVQAAAEEGLAVARQLGDVGLQARMYTSLGFVALLRGEAPDAAEGAVGLAREADDRPLPSGC